MTSQEDHSSGTYKCRYDLGLINEVDSVPKRNQIVEVQSRWLVYVSLDQVIKTSF
jgi:hypothetical protein